MRSLSSLEPPFSADPDRRARQLTRAACAAIPIAFGIFFSFAVPRFGMSMDSPALFYGGDRTLFWLEHPQTPHVFELDAHGDDPKGFHSRYDRSPGWDDPYHYPGFPGFWSSLWARVLTDRWHWMPDIQARHLSLLALHVLGLFLFARYACRLFGATAGLAATVALTLYPSAIGSVINPKDWPSGLFYGVGVLAMGVGLIEGRARQVIAAGLLFGVSLAAKLNGAFGLITVALWSPLVWLLLYRRRRPVTVPLVAAYLYLPVISLVLSIVLWPYLWAGGLPALFQRFAEYLTFMTAYGIGWRPTWSAYALRCLLGYSPPLLLGLATVGLLVGWRGGRQALARWTLLVVWLGFIVLRIAAPHSNFYDGNRHFLEYVPALAMLAGLGAATIGGALVRRFGRLAAAAFALVALADVGIPVVEYYPYETAYFSPLIGGLGGAQARRWLYEPPPYDERRHDNEGDYWSASVPDAVRDLRKVIRPGETFGSCGPWPSQLRVAFQSDDPKQTDTGAADWILETSRSCIESRELSKTRPLILEVHRGGGWVYRILGKRPAFWSP